MRAAKLAGAVAAVVLAAGCASVPDSSPVQVLRQVGGDDPAAIGPVDGSNPLDLVRRFILASGRSADKHAAARAYLTPEAAATWNDAMGVTVLDGQVDTVPAPAAPDGSSGSTTIRIRGTQVGTVTAAGSFEPDQEGWSVDVDVVRRGGQWRISRLPSGVVVRLSDFRDEYRAVRTWFVDPVRRLAVAEQRYIPSTPAAAQAARVMESLLAGPSSALQGAVVSQLPTDAKLRSNLTAAPDGALVVDLTHLGELDEAARRMLLTQVVLSLAEVNVGRVQLLIDGEPILPDKAVWSPADGAPLSADTVLGTDVPALVVAGGRVSQLSATGASTPLPGSLGSGGVDAESAAATADGRHLAVVVRTPTGRTLLVGGGADGGVAPVPLAGRTMTRPSWNPTGTEVWTVRDGGTVSRVMIDNNGQIRVGDVNADELGALGPITDLRLSRDGMHVAAVANGGVYVGAVARGIDGGVAIRNVRRLRPADLNTVAGVDWRSGESLVVITRGPVSPVEQVSVDGLTVSPVLGSNLTPPLTAVAAAPSRPLLVTDQGGVWSFAGGDQDAWRPVVGGGPGAVPVYPG